MKTIVYCATSIDGYIADKHGNLDFLETVPNPEKRDLGWEEFISGIDAILMGRNTYDKVLSFGIDWPYIVPVYVATKSLNQKIIDSEKNIFTISGTPTEMLNELDKNDHKNIYVDGGQLITSFAEEKMIDEINISVIPVLLGDGIKLFNKQDSMQEYKLVESKIQLNQIISAKWIRK